MICKNCKCCKKGWFISKPNDYVCIGVQEPFIIKDISQKCTEYTDKKVTKKAYEVADKLSPPITAISMPWENNPSICVRKIKNGTKLQIGNVYSATLYCDQHFNKFQKIMMKLFFGWRVTDFKEE